MPLTRSSFLLGGLAGLLPAPAWSQGRPLRRPVKVGVLAAGPADDDGKSMEDAFLRELHRTVPQNDVTFEPRYSMGQDGHLPALAAELVEAGCDVIVAWGSASALAAQGATSRLPIVMVGASNPERQGLVRSLARPGGNISGMSDVALETQPKVMQVMRDAFPERQRMAVIWNSENPCSRLMQQEGYSPAAASLGFQSLGVDIHSDASMAQAFEDMLRWRADIIFAPGYVWPFRDEVFRFAREHRIPVGSGLNILSRSGAVVTYGPDYDWISARAGDYLARVIRGESLADMPVEQPMKLELTLNMRLARSLGVEIGPLAEAQANHIIG